ncbi:MAG: hypothetical protein GX559_02330, partial [Candidatus Pacebacteria bacterium]|nr:hypothetical protein [Candidatus Paceibacterota bacterium]
MPKNHILLKIKTSKDGEETAEAAVQLLSTLPKLKNNLFEKLLGKNERLSFEILVREQSIHFLINVPVRLLAYFKGAIHASYPKAVIEEMDFDPVDYFLLENRQLAVSSFKLKNRHYLPLKTYHDFADIDPLATLMSTLSKNEGEDTILIQLLLATDFSFFSIDQTPSTEELAEHPQQQLIKQKLEQRQLRAAFKIAVATDDRQKSQLLLSNIAAAYQATSRSESNELLFSKRLFLKNCFIKSM